MYQPPHHQESRAEVLQAFLARHHLATLVSMTSQGLIATHLPMIFDPNVGARGRLIGHVSRANPQWRDFDSRIEALAIFLGPQAYISPSWYASKREHGKVVPTWNYLTVHLYGRLSTFDEGGRLLDLLNRLTDREEMTRATPWAVSDAPHDFVAKQLKGIVGLELVVTRIEGKWKASQNRPAGDRAGVIAALEAEGSDDALEIAETMRKMEESEPG